MWGIGTGYIAGDCRKGNQVKGYVSQWATETCQNWKKLNSPLTKETSLACFLKLPKEKKGFEQPLPGTTCRLDWEYQRLQTGVLFTLYIPCNFKTKTTAVKVINIQVWWTGRVNTKWTRHSSSVMGLKWIAIRSWQTNIWWHYSTSKHNISVQIGIKNKIIKEVKK